MILRQFFSTTKTVYACLILVFILIPSVTNQQTPTLTKSTSSKDRNKGSNLEAADEIEKDKPSDVSISDEPILLESMEDLHHLTYLLLRNYNISDDGLLQSSWLTGLGNAIGSHKQYQFAAGPTSISDVKSRLALELESFISHLRNGHLRRIGQDDLEALMATLNLTDSLDELQKRNYNVQSSMTSNVVHEHVNHDDFEAQLIQVSETEKRCNYLVALYKFELAYRYAKQQELISVQDLLTNQPDSTRFETNPNSRILNASMSSSVPKQEKSMVSSNKSVDVVPPRVKNYEGSNGKSAEAERNVVRVDDSRLLSLCKLAVDCQTADDMVRLINRPLNSLNKVKAKIAKQASGDNGGSTDQPRHEDAIWASDEIRFVDNSERTRDGEQGKRGEPIKWVSKSLRDSLSLSLAKLCPLMLFQLHEDDEQCSVRRDDTPPMLAVWGFATLFVTIVSFCSLIGLSITPLIGQSPTVDGTSIGSSSSSSLSSSIRGPNDVGNGKVVDTANALNQQHPNQQHKATLTIFEGLAVGSLVGSALFSLIPQAFELQERESNQSFLMKAFIIFLGIYLFFCSERIMRIILDTRQMSKRNKRLQNRSSTTAAAEPIDQALAVAQVHVPQCTVEEQKRSKSFASDSGLGAQNKYGIQNMHDDVKMKSDRSQLGSTSGQQNLKTKMTQARKSKSKSSRNTSRSRGRQLRKKRQKGTTRRRNLACLESDCDEYYQLRRTSSISSLESNSSDVSRNSSRQRAIRDGLITFKVYNRDLDRGEYCTLSSDFWSDSSRAAKSWRSCDTDDDRNGQHNEARVDRDHEGRWQDHDSSDQGFDVENQNAKHDQYTSCEGQNNRFVFDIMDSPSQDRGRGKLSTSETHNDTQAQHPKQEISTVAWMIILGDGLHNFIDGISIGAAFSESILSGVSISVAVICEEFPHELGDFAVLVSSGMTVRQALGYNFLSACTCYFGMAIGIILGDVTDCASYISALAAGVFLYIALVDMMGELSAALEASSKDSITRTLKLFLLQNVGISIGISIIFVLSFIDF